MQTELFDTLQHLQAAFAAKENETALRAELQTYFDAVQRCARTAQSDETLLFARVGGLQILRALQNRIPPQGDAPVFALSECDFRASRGLLHFPCLRCAKIFRFVRICCARRANACFSRAKRKFSPPAARTLCCGQRSICCPTRFYTVRDDMCLSTPCAQGTGRC